MPVQSSLAQPGVVRARNAVAVVFAANGFAIASWTARLPEVRDALAISPGQVGTLLLAISFGSLAGLPIAGALVRRFGATAAITGAAVVDALGVACAGVGATGIGAYWLAWAGLLLLGFGSGIWDVAMNVEGAAVEHALGRTIMPRFHAGFSLGTVLGAAVGAVAAALAIPVALHLIGVGVLVAGSAALAAPGFLPAREAADAGPRTALRAWLEPRTLVIGLMVLALALTEGAANDWLAVALVDGYDAPAWLGAAGFAVFLTAMTTGRMLGTRLLDRFGRLPVIWATMGTAFAGVLLVVFAGWLPLALAGAAIWGLGASLGFPVGMSAAADDPEHAATRVGVVSTIAYTAFLAGPPLLGYLGDHVGTLHALLVIAVLLIPSAVAVPAARGPRRSSGSASPARGSTSPRPESPS